MPVAWVGDFETNDLSQWDYKLHEEYITVVDTPVTQGAHAARIQLMNDAVWPNGLKRVELHHTPGPGRTAEGADDWFAWSFYLEATLPTDPDQTIGYWESDQSYQQVMAFHVAGEHIEFITQKPQYQVHWEQDGLATAGVWHRIAMHIHWSKNEADGRVDIWFDGTQVVTDGPAATLADDNTHFTQVGLLRGAIEFQDMPVIFLDDAVEGDSLEDVHPDPSTGSGGAGGSGGSMGNVGGGGSPGVGGGGSPGAGGSGGPPFQGFDPESDEESGCGCRTAPTSSSQAWLLALLLSLGTVRRCKRRY